MSNSIFVTDILGLSESRPLVLTCLPTQFGLVNSAVKWEAVTIHWFLDEKSCGNHHTGRHVALLLTLEKMAVPDRVRLMSSASRQDWHQWSAKRKPLNRAMGVGDAQPVRSRQRVEASRAGPSKDKAGGAPMSRSLWVNRNQGRRIHQRVEGD